MKKRNVGTSALDVDDALRSALKISPHFISTDILNLVSMRHCPFTIFTAVLAAEPALIFALLKIDIAENIKLAKIEMKRRRHEKEGD